MTIALSRNNNVASECMTENKKLMDDIHKGTTIYGGGIGNKFHFLVKCAFIEFNPLLGLYRPNKMSAYDNYEVIEPEYGNRVYFSPLPHTQICVIALELYDHDIDMNYPVITYDMDRNRIGDSYHYKYIYCPKGTDDYNIFGGYYPVFYPSVVYESPTKIIPTVSLSHELIGNDSGTGYPQIRINGSVEIWMTQITNNYLYYDNDNTKLGYWKEIGSELRRMFTMSYLYAYLKPSEIHVRTYLNQIELEKELNKLANIIQIETNATKINYAYSLNTKPNI